MKCPKCKGKGQVFDTIIEDDYMDTEMFYKNCDLCSGSGSVLDEGFTLKEIEEAYNEAEEVMGNDFRFTVPLYSIFIKKLRTKRN